jgi:hypothetical protein
VAAADLLGLDHHLVLCGWLSAAACSQMLLVEVACCFLLLLL